jgi:hypothetical protein
MAKVIDKPLNNCRSLQQEIKVVNLHQIPPGITFIQNLNKLFRVSFISLIKHGVSKIGHSKEFGDTFLN